MKDNLRGLQVCDPESPEVASARKFAAGITREPFFQEAKKLAGDEPKAFPREFVRECAKYGLLGMEIPEENYGGTQMSHSEQVVVVEELAREHAGLALSILVLNALTAYEINKFGTEAQKDDLLPKMAKGDICVSFGLTEPDYGSDATNIQLQAKIDQEKGQIVLNGAKRFITGANGADEIVLSARTGEPNSGKKGMTVLLVDMKSPGVRVPEPYSKLGQPGSPLCEVYFDNVSVPIENVLGGPERINKGWEIINDTLNHSRSWIAAQGVGLAQGCIDGAAEYAEVRKIRGVPLAEIQEHADYFKVMNTQIDIARRLVQLAAKYEDEGNPRFNVLSSLAKLVGCDTTPIAALEAMMLTGGIGYTSEMKIAQQFLDSPVLRIYEGSPFVQIKKVIIPGGISGDVIYDLLPPKLSSGYLKLLNELVHPEAVDVALDEWQEAGEPSDK